MAANTQLCPKEKMASLIALVTSDPAGGIQEIDNLLRNFPNDPRLHFLKGSFLAGRQDYKAARNSMRRAVDLAPNYEVARFQLGFLLLTSGEPHAAQEAWGPLYALPEDNYLRTFVVGLCHLIRDEFGETISVLQEGIARNKENLPMNGDMQLIIDEVRQKMSAGGEQTVSSVDLLLQQAAMKSTKH